MSDDRLDAMNTTLNILVWFVAIFGIVATAALIVALTT